jgi:hypothetical protein
MKRKRLFRLLFSVALFLVALELSPWLISPLNFGKGYSRGELKSELMAGWEVDTAKADTASAAAENEYLGDALLHPYTGYTSVPHKEYNRFAFPGIDPLMKRSPDKVNIVITGGSVAMGLYGSSKEKIKARLKQDPAYKDKDIHIALFALGGFKQPQQLMALNYFLSQGGEYDMVINLDGFNEVVLPYADNLPFKVYPSYPRHWHIFSRKKLDQRAQLILAKQALLKEERLQNRKRLGGSFWRYSNFRLLLWKMGDLRREQEFFALESQLDEVMKTSESSFQSTGPSYEVPDTTQFFAEQALVWARCSRQMDALGKGMGFRYFHFLQPNQYVKESKPLTAEEKVNAIEEGPFDYKTGAISGYPFLIQEGEKLRQSGVAFTDLTPMFRNDNSTVYVDKCCHFNEHGYELIAMRICEVILAK